MLDWFRNQLDQEELRNEENCSIGLSSILLSLNFNFCSRKNDVVLITEDAEEHG